MRTVISEPPPSGVKVVRVGKRRIVVATPNVRQYGHQADEIVFALAYARLVGASVVFRRPETVPSEAMFAIESSEVEIERSSRLQMFALGACNIADAADGFRAWRERNRQQFQRELLRQLSTYRETHRRNHLVKWKRDAIKVKRRQSASANTGPPRPYWRRRLVADPVEVRLLPAAERQASEAAARLGIGPDAKLVTVHVRERGYKLGAEVQDKGSRRDDSVRNARIESHFATFDYLNDRGYTVVRIGDPTMVPVVRPGVVDLATLPDRDPYLELYCLWRSDFLICGESGPQGAAYLTDTPSLTVNATDPVSSFPVRSDGIYLLKSIFDRQTGQKLSSAELVSEYHLAELRDPTRWLFVENTSEEILDAVQEIEDLLESGTAESPSQTRYKQLLAGSIAPMRHLAYVRKWGIDDGFLGNGRLARSQADAFYATDRERGLVPAQPVATAAEVANVIGAPPAEAEVTAPLEREPDPGSKRILFVMQHLGFVRNYEPTLRLLDERGHRIHIEYLEERPGKGENAFADWLLHACSNVTISRSLEPERGHWPALARAVRMLVDYVRYFDSRYDGALIVRGRALKLLPRAPQWLFERLSDRGVQRAIKLLKRVETAIPATKGTRSLLDKLGPDLVLVTPLVDFASRQVDYLKAARAVGIPTGLCVASWDNLTNKGHMRFVPDRVFVWNEPQKEEAVVYHDVPAENVVVTGAQLFDHWFGWSPKRSREEFCRTTGLDPDRPFIVFLGSTHGVAPNEVMFVERWVQSLRRARDESVANLGVLIRPHPAAAKRYLSLDLSHLDDVSVWPPLVKDRSDIYADPGKNDFFESLYYSAAAVGVNTSALIEAAIVGRTVCTLRLQGAGEAQDGTLHFAHLANGRSGFLRVAHDMDAHLGDLADAVAGGGDEARTHAFVRHFVRPHGLDKPAAPILANEIEVAARLAVERRPAPFSDLVLRLLLFPLAVVVALSSRPPADKNVPLWVRLARPFIATWVRLVALGLAVPPRISWEIFRRRVPKLRKRVRRLLIRVRRRIKRGISELRKRVGRRRTRVIRLVTRGVVRVRRRGYRLLRGPR